MNDDLCYRTLTEAGAMLRRGEVSPVELTRAVLDRIGALDARLQSYLTLAPERALESAATAARELRAGRDRGPLHGIPIGVKDLCFTRGVRTTCASHVLKDWVPDSDAAVVERLADAGAISLGKLNLTEFALSGYGQGLPIPCNPWNTNLHAGGSSSGSGVATAAGLCFASLGTDTGGSIRIPAAWCGVVGLKPTYGRVSRYGVFPLGMTLDHIGPMTRSVADAAAVLEVIAGADPRDPTSLDTPPPRCVAGLEGGVRGLRLGFDADFVQKGAHPSVATALDAALAVFTDLGAEVVPVSLPPVDELVGLWALVCSAEALVAHRATFPARAAAYGTTFRTFLEYGASMRAEDYAHAHVQRVDFARRLQAIFRDCDALACPGAFMQAPPATLIDPYGPFTSEIAPFMRFTAPFNFSGNPTLSVPAGFSADGVPHGLQLVGPLLGEAMLCRVGHAYEQATEWHLRRPPL